MKKTTSVIVLFFLISTFAIAQQNGGTKVNPYSGSTREKKSKLDERIYFGGNLFFSLGSYTSIGIWPMAGYKITPKFSVGLQPGYEYLKYDSYYGGRYETSNYGVRIFSRYRIITQAYAHVEYANINYELQYRNINGDLVEERAWVPFLFVGGGLSQPLGGRAFAYVQLLFDVLQDENSPYGSNEMFWSVGIVAGF
jgi:hypothetical protein